MLHRNVNTGAQQRATSSTDTNQQQRATSSTDTNQQQRATSSSSSSGNTQYFNIGNNRVDRTAATATYEPRVDKLIQEAAVDKQQQETRHQQELARIIHMANQELNEQEERLNKKRDADLYRLFKAQAQRELDEYHEAQHDDGRLFRNKGTKVNKSEDDTGSRPRAKAKATVIPNPPAPPPAIANVTPAPPPVLQVMAAKPKQANAKSKAKHRRILALGDGRPHHEDAPDNKRTKTKVEMADDRDPYGHLTIREIRHLLRTNFDFKKTYNSFGQKLNKAELLDELKQRSK